VKRLLHSSRSGSPLHLQPVRIAAALLVGVAIWSMMAALASAQSEEDVAALVAVVERNNAEFAQAYQTWDVSGLDQYLTGEQLQRRLEEVARARHARGRVYAVLEEFEVLSVTFPEPNVAMVETSETWWANRLSSNVDVTDRSRSTQSYELWRIDGRWYIAANDILTIED
jgi:hypothetical protein